MFRSRISFPDVFVTAICLLLAALLLLLPLLGSREQQLLVVSTPDGETSYPLDIPATFTVCGNGHTLTVTIANGQASVTASDCRDGVCLATPAISESGQTILCAPAGICLLIRRKGGSPNVDFIAG